MHEQTVDQPGDQASRDPADLLHRQGCRYACDVQRQVRRIRIVLKTVEVPPAQFVGRVMVTPVIMQMCQCLMKRIARWRKGVPPRINDLSASP